MQLTDDHPDAVDALRYTLFGGPAQGRRDWIADMSNRLDLNELDLDD